MASIQASGATTSRACARPKTFFDNAVATELGPATGKPDPKKVKASLDISAAMPQEGGPCEKINYDPRVMAEGIAPTADPILNFRSSSYAVSFSRRVQGK